MSIGAIGTSAGLQDIMTLRQQIVDRSDLLRSLDTIYGSELTSQTSAVGGGFVDVLKDALENVSATQRKASELSSAYERGEVSDIAQVMLARQEAGIAFEATLQVRNKLLSAYQEIMRMVV